MNITAMIVMKKVSDSNKKVIFYKFIFYFYLLKNIKNIKDIKKYKKI